MKKDIKIRFVDFYKGFDDRNNEFVEVLSKKYKVVPQGLHFKKRGNRRNLRLLRF